MLKNQYVSHIQEQCMCCVLHLPAVIYGDIVVTDHYVTLPTKSQQKLMVHYISMS